MVIAVMSNKTKKIGILCVAAVAMVVVLNMIWGSSAIDEYKKTAETALTPDAEKVLHEVLTCIEKDDMKKLYEINTNFCVGHADYAFSGIRYPEGNKPVGSIWPFGLYICPNTHRFFCFFHNETGWNGKGTGYDAYGYCKQYG